MDKTGLLKQERRLAEMLKSFLDFESYSVYFPQVPLLCLELVEDEQVLLAPLVLSNRYLGAIRLDGVDMFRARQLAPFLQPIINLALANLELEESKDRDAETGLLTESAFLEMLAARFAHVPFEKDVADPDLCLGMAVFIWPHGQLAQRRLKTGEFNELRQHLVHELLNNITRDSFAGRLGWLNGRHAFGLVFPASGRGAVHRRARTVYRALHSVLLEHDLAKVGVGTDLLVGHALYPQDLRGSEMRLDGLERARILRSRARLAAEMSREAEHLSLPVLGYAWLSSQAGRIVEILDSGLVRINLGSDANIVTGDRFHVIQPGVERVMLNSKGQVIVSGLSSRDAQARVLHIERPAHPPAIGDMLIPASPLWPVQEDNDVLMSQQRFREKFALASKGCQNFCLVIVKFATLPEKRQAFGSQQDIHARLSRFLQSASFAELKAGLAGWYGNAGLIIFLPGSTARDGREFCRRLHGLASTVGFSGAFGLFPYPFLNFRRSESEACALKALAYAELLPEPHIGVFDYLALTISADRRFSEGDELGAMEEYKLALLLKPNEPSILNSLGVCMGALNRNNDAIGLFMAAAENCSDKELAAHIFYNLGTIYEKENDFHEARGWFRKCARCAPDYIYAWIRLGRIYAQTGRLAGARAFYRHALKLSKDTPQLLNVIERHLARLENKRSQTEKARELLHDALLRDPGDGESLLLLAQTYLEDDPEIAEQLARRCVRMGFDGWLTVAEALDAMGQHEEAERARASRSER